jgi:hypothetical protein
LIFILIKKRISAGYDSLQKKKYTNNGDVTKEFKENQTKAKGKYYGN